MDSREPRRTSQAIRGLISKIFSTLEIKSWFGEINQEPSAETTARRIEGAKNA